MINFVPKPSVEEETKQSAIKILEDAISDVRSGQVNAAIVILSRPDGYWMYKASRVKIFTTLVGQLEIIKQDFIKDYLRGDE